MKTIKNVEAKKALDLMRGTLVGIETRTTTFGQAGVIPAKYVPSGKAVILQFFPGVGQEVTSRLRSCKNQLDAMSIQVGNAAYIRMDEYEKAGMIVQKAVDSCKEIVADKILPKLADYKSDYLCRAEAALAAEGVTATDMPKAMAEMERKFPTSFNVDMILEVYGFPVPSDVPAGVTEEVAKMLQDGNNAKILATWGAVVGNIYGSLFEAAANIANSLERNSGKIGSRTLGLANNASAKAKAFIADLGESMTVGNTEEAVTVFDTLFKDNIESITPTTARMYAAILYNEAKTLKAHENLDLAAIGMDEESAADFDMAFTDLI